MLLAIEGLDGAGKTAVSQRIAATLEATYVRVPPPELDLRTNELLLTLQSSIRYMYYMAGVAAVGQLSQDKHIVVADRYVSSAHALHQDVQSDLAKWLRSMPVVEADMTVFLQVDEAERRRRLRLRGRELDPFELALERDDGMRYAVERRLKVGNDAVIDTTGLPVSEVAAIVCHLWRHR